MALSISSSGGTDTEARAAAANARDMVLADRAGTMATLQSQVAALITALGNVQAAPGPQGAKGDTGAVGPTGADGAQGPAGTPAPVLPVEVLTLALTAATAPAAASAVVNVELISAAKATRRKVDLTNATQIRLVSMVIANGNAPTAAIKVSYMTTEAATWAGTDTGCAIVLGAGTAGALRDSGWVALPIGAKAAGVTLAGLVSVAFGTTAPTIGSLTVYVK